MKRKPWLKFHAQDWLADPHLRMCSPVAHGLLINLMSIAHSGEPYGYIVNGGMAIGPKEASKILGWNAQTVAKAWAELEQNGRIMRAEEEQEASTSRARGGHDGSRKRARVGHEVGTMGAMVDAWCIPRMVKDHEYSLQQSELGKSGGNPTLKAPLKAPLKLEQNKNKNKSKNKSKIQSGLSVFVPPTPDEVNAYSASIGYPIDGQAWCDSYEQKGWMVGKSKMKSWQAAVRNWKANGWQPAGGKAEKIKSMFDEQEVIP